MSEVTMYEIRVVAKEGREATEEDLAAARLLLLNSIRNDPTLGGRVPEGSVLEVRLVLPDVLQVFAQTDVVSALGAIP